MRLEDKVVVITGAASGMGLAMARIFTAEGASVVAGDWNGERLGKAVQEITAASGKITGQQGDISDKASAEALVNLAVETYGKLDVLVNNAGIMDYMAGIDAVTDDIWDKVLKVNLYGPMYTSRRAVQIMLEAGHGSIINIGSTASLSGGAAGVAYTTSKHALLGLTKNVAWMYAKRGIRCNAVLPGGTNTNIQETMPQDKLDPVGLQRQMEFGSLCPLYLESEDIAKAALFFASDDSRFINGAVLTADGGWMAL